MTEETSHSIRCCGPEGCGESRPSRQPAPMDAGNPRLRFCIGRACMAWRSMESAEFKTKAETEFRKTGIRLAGNEGFCGLAGKP